MIVSRVLGFEILQGNHTHKSQELTDKAREYNRHTLFTHVSSGGVNFVFYLLSFFILLPHSSLFEPALIFVSASASATARVRRPRKINTTSPPQPYDKFPCRRQRQFSIEIPEKGGGRQVTSNPYCFREVSKQGVKSLTLGFFN